MVTILETALYVSDLDASERFYLDLLDAETMLADDRMRALSLGDRQVLLLFVRGGSVAGEETPGGKIPGHDATGRQHLCFGVEAVGPWRRRLEERGTAIESEVSPPQGGRSVYFRDPDGHCVEFAEPAIWPWPALS